MAKIDTRSARAKLQGDNRYWQMIEPGLAVGYRRPVRGGAGTWSARALVGKRQHRVAALGTADDGADPDGARVLDWKQAQKAARAWASGQTTSAEPLTVAGAVERYATDLAARKGAQAAREVRGRLHKHMPAGLGQVRLADLTTAQLVSWRNGMVDPDGDEDELRRSRDSANRVLTMARAAFNLAFNGGLVSSDLAWRRVEPFKAVGQARRVILDESEIQRLIDVCEPGLRELVLAGALTGARLGELTAARLRDFDAAAAILMVSGKTGERPIHLPPAAVALFKQLAGGKRPQDHLLVHSGGPWTKSLHRRAFESAVARVGLDQNTVFYSLRHSWISRALQTGVPPKAVADHCGTSIAMLQRYYAKAFPGDQQRYATMAAPAVAISDAAGKVVVPLHQAGR